MGLFQRRGHDDDQQQVPGALDDLEAMVCPRCRRDLHPWQQVCPDDGASAVARSSLPPRHAPPPPHLLEDSGGDVG